MLPAFHLATVQHDELPPTRSKCYWLLPRIFTWGTLALLVLLLLQSIGGFTLYQPSLFGYHILGMSTFVLIGNQESILLYTDPLLCCSRYNSTSSTTLCSLLLYLFSFICLIGGAISMFYYKNQLVPYHFYSTHSWLGIACVLSWLIQVIINSFCITYWKNLYSYITKTTYILGLTSCALGLQEIQTFTNMSNYVIGYNDTSVVPVMNTSWWSLQANIGVLLLACTGIITLYATSTAPQ